MIKKIEVFFLGWLLLLLATMTVAAIAGWQYTDYATYTFYISWGVLFAFYTLWLRNYYSLFVLGLMAGAIGLFLALTHYGDPSFEDKTAAALLLGKISLTVFAATLAVRLYRKREELGANSPVFLALVVLLFFQVLVQDVYKLDAFSLNGFSNYFTTGVIAHILLNDMYAAQLKEGEKKVLVLQTLFCLYNISLMLVQNFA